MSEQVTGGTQRHSLTVAVFRPWRGLAGSAAPGLPGRGQGYPMWGGMSINGFMLPIELYYIEH